MFFIFSLSMLHWTTIMFLLKLWMASLVASQSPFLGQPWSMTVPWWRFRTWSSLFSPSKGWTVQVSRLCKFIIALFHVIFQTQVSKLYLFYVFLYPWYLLLFSHLQLYSLLCPGNLLTIFFTHTSVTLLAKFSVFESSCVLNSQYETVRLEFECFQYFFCAFCISIQYSFVILLSF